MQKKSYFAKIMAATVLFAAWSGTAFAVMNGPCNQCHTMHNSQDGLPMRYNNSSTPIGQLLRGDCLGCHAQGANQALYTIGVDVIPQVYHTDPANDLAGGNFAYIDGTKGGAASDGKGHNINEIPGVGPDAILIGPPGGIVRMFHDDGGVVGDPVTAPMQCAGTNGCHGIRDPGNDFPAYNGITGAHHNNVNGVVNQGAADMEPGHGYRFLLGVNGYEDTDWQYTKSASDHNEYAGRATPVTLTGCNDATGCHSTTAGGIRAPNGTMAEYCGTCHGNFHTLDNGDGSDGIGPAASSPFIRHPSDLALPAAGEYLAYATYLTVTPVARVGTWVGGPSAGVSAASGTDSVFCLSCHVAHGSPYPDMLKWDYATMQVGNGGAATGTGCFACHSLKD